LIILQGGISSHARNILWRPLGAKTAEIYVTLACKRQSEYMFLFHIIAKETGTMNKKATLLSLVLCFVVYCLTGFCICV